MTIVKRVALTGIPGSDTFELKKQFNNLVRLSINRVFTDGGIGIATNTAKVRNTATINYTVNGVFAAKASTDDLWTLTGAAVTVGLFQKWLLCLDAAGTASVIVGTAASTAAGVVLPDLPDDKAVVGILQVEVTSGTFTPGTTALSAAGITDTYFDGPGDGLSLVVLGHDE